MTKPFNPHDAEQVKANEERLKIKTIEEREDLKWILSDAKGRRFLWRLLAQCKVYQSTMTGNSFTFFNEGKREIGLFVQSEILATDDEAYLKMLKEFKGVI